MTEELRQRLAEIDEVQRQVDEAVENAKVVESSNLYAVVTKYRLAAFPLLVSEVERLEKERQQAADHLFAYTRAAANGDEDAESEAYWALFHSLNPDIKDTTKSKEG